MKTKTAIKIYEWASWACILGATVMCFFRTMPSIVFSALLLALGVFMRLMIERKRREEIEAENEELRNDLRRLTLLLAEAKQQKNN